MRKKSSEQIPHDRLERPNLLRRELREGKRNSSPYGNHFPDSSFNGTRQNGRLRRNKAEKLGKGCWNADPAKFSYIAGLGYFWITVSFDLHTVQPEGAIRFLGSRVTNY